MIRLACLAGLLVGAIFWNRTGPLPPAWPTAVPALADVRTVSATTFKNGAAHVSGASGDSPARLMANLRAAYAVAGWSECPVTAKLADCALFTKGPAVAAAVVRPTDAGSFLTLLQRPQ